MDTPQEVVVWYVLPALRREFVISLKENGLKQKEIASILGITEPAVSQYIKNKRGGNVALSKDIRDNIKRKVVKINNNMEYKKAFQDILREVRTSRFMCSVCNKHIETHDKCDICY